MQSDTSILRVFALLIICTFIVAGVQATRPDTAPDGRYGRLITPGSSGWADSLAPSDSPGSAGDESSGYEFVTAWGSPDEGWFKHPSGVAVDAYGNVYVSDFGNHSILKFDSSGAFIMKWGSEGSDKGQFLHPRGLAVDGDGNVYVADLDNHSIQKFDSAGALIKKWGAEGAGDGEFSFPEGVAVDAGGNVYVVESGNRRIQKFNSAGTFITKWGTEGSGEEWCYFPADVVVDSAGNVYVVDRFNPRIQKFDSSGTFLMTWGTEVSDDGREFYPENIAVDDDDNIYVAAPYPCILKFDTSGTLITQIMPGGFGSELSWWHPESIAVDGEGNMYVADVDNHRILKFDSAGAFIMKWGTEGSGEGQLWFPKGVAVDRDGNVYVADSQNHRIQKFDGTGTFIMKWGTLGCGDGQFCSPMGVAVDRAGHVYVADTYNSRIQKFDSAGAFIMKWGTEGSGEGQLWCPMGVAVDRDGNVYVSEYYNDRIQKFAPTASTPTQPRLHTDPATNITSTGAVLHGHLENGGAGETYEVCFRYHDEGGEKTKVGFSTVSAENPIYEYAVTGLEPNTTYYYRAVHRDSTDPSSPNPVDAENYTTFSTLSIDLGTLKPVNNYPNNIFTQKFANYLDNYNGKTFNGFHGGEDLRAGIGDPVYSVLDGEVVKISDLGDLGSLIAVKHDGRFVIPGRKEITNGPHEESYEYPEEEVTSFYSIYIHVNAAPYCDEGATVSAGQQIASIANISSAGLGSHLHFEIRHPEQKNSSDWSLVGNESNWATFDDKKYNGYYFSPQTMVDDGLRRPLDFLLAQSSQTSSPPVASFTAYPTSGEAPLTVEFTDTSTGNPTSWLWDFGDGQSASDPNPIHTYAQAGSYSVALTAGNANGEDTSTQSACVVVRASSKVPEGGRRNVTVESEHPYANNFQHTWKIVQPGADQMRLHFDKLNLDEDDYLIVNDGYGKQLIEYGTYYSSYMKDDFWTDWETTDTLVLTLVTDNGGNAYGFLVDLIEFRNEAAPSTSQVAESYHPYANNYEHTWKIVQPGADQMRLHFDKLNLDEDDYLTIYDGYGNKLIEYGFSYSGYMKDDFWTDWETTDTLLVRLVTDNGGNAYGFLIDRIEFRNETAPSTSQVTESYHPYANNYGHTWKIVHSGADQMRLHFDKLNLDEDDYLTIYDGYGNKLIEYGFSYSGYMNDDFWTDWETTDTLVVRLVTDNGGNAYGFLIDRIEFRNETAPSTSQVAESYHPYANNYAHTWKIVQPGAAHMRLHFDKLNLDEDDYLTIYDGYGNKLINYGFSYSVYMKDDFWTEWEATDTLVVRLVTDNGGNAYGFLIDSIETD